MEIDMNFRNSVGARLMLAFAGVIVVFGVAVSLSIGRLAVFNSSISDITTRQLDKVLTAQSWQDAISESMRHARNLLIMDDKAEIQNEIAKIHALSEKRAKVAEQMATLVQSAEGKTLLKDAMDARALLTPLDDEYLREVQAGDIKAAKDTLLQKSRPAQLAVVAALEKISEHEEANIHRRADEIAASYQSTRMLLISLALGAVAVACVLAYLITRAIKKPLNHAVDVLGEIEKGNYSSTVTVGSRDEIGQALLGLQRMQTTLRERTERDHAAAMENARIRTALDRVSVGTMLGDTEGKIIYVNDALRDLFRNLAVEIRKAVPSFDPHQPLGNSFDAFHQIPSLQRHQLSALTATHTVDVKMGEASLRIVASPVDDAGRRVGTVVQWVDRTSEVATEEEVQAIVVKAIDGDLTARIREEGKEAFFKALAGGVNRLLANMADVVGSMAQAAAEVR